ncbi:MAG TPA: hypothetical protein VIW92_09405 [Thermoanaerobaculia bacterium]
MRRILGNLLGEADLARRRTSPPRSVLEKASKMATLLRVFVCEGDRLWLPAAVDPESIPEIPGLPRPILESGPLRALPSVDEVLAWCETPEAAAHRVQPRDPSQAAGDAPLHEILWRLPVPSPSVVARVHHRAFCLQIAKDLGCALPGARMVESMTDLDRTDVTGWVVKAPLSAAGRDRHIERAGFSDPKARRTVERLFERHGPLLFEPWMDRMADYGVSALLTPEGTRIVGVHRQRVDRKGQFGGIDLSSPISPEIRDRLTETALTVGEALRREGYVGPFGIDAWEYRREDGATVLHPLGEINARMTFGLVAWAMFSRLREG